MCQQGILKTLLYNDFIISTFQDPRRTRKAKIKKLINRKKYTAYRKRRELQAKRELKKFTEKEKTDNNLSAVSDPSSSCLKGGAPNDKRKLTNCVSSNELQLINRGTDCFVNSVVQLIRNTAYAPFIRAHIPMLVADSTEDSYKLSKRLSYIYSANSVGQPKSTAFIRSHVAHMSGKHYLDSKTQQDAEEFMRALEIVLS